MKKNKTVSILGIDVAIISMGQAINALESMIKKKDTSLICTANVDHLIRLQRDKDFYKVYQRANLIVADGMPLVWISSLFGKKIPERIAGVDLLEQFVALSVIRKYRLFFLGGTKKVLKDAVKKLTQRHGKFKVETHAPIFANKWSDAENKKIIRKIKLFKPSALFVGVGAPKQEGWIYEHLEEVGVPLSMGVGAAFEFIAGTKKRAPVWMQKSGLEWLFRLVQEPKRLSKRYLVRDMLFPVLVIKDRFKAFIKNKYK